MSKKQVEVTTKGFHVKPDPTHESQKAKSKGLNQNDRIEAKLDLILEKLRITL